METHRARDIESVPVPGSIEQADIDVSVCIVTYQARDLLRESLLSLYRNTSLCFEVTVVDNGSRDGVEQMLHQEFPDVSFIEESKNAGFTKPMNRAMRYSRGNYLLLLNPDTLIFPGAVDQLVSFLETNPEVGICGPKVLNKDLSLQPPCRRGESRPWAVFTYITGLAALFPKNKLFGQYLMSFIDEDKTHPVAGVAGSCMLIRRAVLDQIGYLDERFFAYQEDADYCFRARQTGWQVYYVPSAQIIHYGGMGGSRVEPYRSIYEWHRSYYLYFRKNLAKDYFFLFNWIYYFTMMLKLLSALAMNLIRKGKFNDSQ